MLNKMCVPDVAMLNVLSVDQNFYRGTRPSKPPPHRRVYPL